MRIILSRIRVVRVCGFLMATDVKWFDNSVGFQWSQKYVGHDGVVAYNVAAFSETYLLQKA